MLRREVVDANVRGLSALGFKILLDILATSKSPLKIVEVPYTFRDRFAGESKLDSMALWDFGMLLADKTIGRFVPVRFVAFTIVGGLGVFVHMLALSVALKGFGLDFLISQATATFTAMIFNFAVNNSSPTVTSGCGDGAGGPVSPASSSPAASARLPMSASRITCS